MFLNIPDATFRRVTLTEAEEEAPHLSPDGAKIAYVRNNNLYVYWLGEGREQALTTDGSQTVLNGKLSWVYWEEIYGRRERGYEWSPDSRAIAYYRFDESAVSLQYFVSTHPWTPKLTTQRYPRVGETLPTVAVKIAELEDGATRPVTFGDHRFAYIVRLDWAPDASRLAVQTMNRAQTALDLLFAERRTGTTSAVLRETSEAWVNILDDFVFLADGSGFLWPSERDGYLHLYRYGMDGTLINRVTSGPWALRSGGGIPSYVQRSVVSVDEAAGVWSMRWAARLMVAAR